MTHFIIQAMKCNPICHRKFPLSNIFCGNSHTLTERENPEEDVCFVLYDTYVFHSHNDSMYFFCFLAMNTTYSETVTFCCALNIWYHQKKQEKNMIVLSELIIQQY